MQDDLDCLDQSIHWLQCAYSNARAGHENTLESFTSLDPATLHGSCCFMSREDALLYYRPYGGDSEDVDRKIAAGEIKIGKPKDAVKLNSENRWMCQHPSVSKWQEDEHWMRQWLSFLIGMECEVAAGYRLRLRLQKALTIGSEQSIKHKCALKELLDKRWRVIWKTDLPYCTRGRPHFHSGDIQKVIDEPSNAVLFPFVYKGVHITLALVRQWSDPTDLCWGLKEEQPARLLLVDGHVYAHLTKKNEARALIEDLVKQGS